MPGLISKFVEFGEWMPDQPAMGNGATVVKNCIPQAKSYRSVNGLVSFTNALNSRPLNAFWVRDSSSDYYNFAGTATKLYSLSGTTWTDISQAGDYTVESWEFAKWGDRVIATSIEEPVQYYDMGTSALFADLPGSPPQAKHVAVIGDFIFLGNLKSGSTFHPERFQWSGFNSSELWTPSLSTQSDFQDIFGKGGDIQKIIPGNDVSAIIFQEHAITVWEYKGPPTIFTKVLDLQDRGCAAPNSVCWQGETVFFYSHDGFYIFNGEETAPIGAEKVDRFFKEDVSDLSTVYGAVDRKNRSVFWLYTSRETGGNRMLCFKPVVNRWSVIDIDAEMIFEYSAAAYNLDNIDSLLVNGIDADSFNMDESPYKGGEIDFVAFAADHKLAAFSGAPLTATIETGEFSDFGKRISVKAVRPVVDGTAVVAAGTRDTQNTSYTYGASQPRNDAGECGFRTSARYHRFKVSISGGFDHAIGADVIYRNEGRR